MQSSTPSTPKRDHVSLAVSGTVLCWLVHSPGGWHRSSGIPRLRVGVALRPYGITVPYRSHLEELNRGTGARHYFFFLVSDFGAVFLGGFWTPFAFVPDFAVFLTDAFVAGAAFAAFFAGDFLG